MKRRPNRIGEFREARGLTQEALAEKCATTHATIGRLENGKRGLSEKWLRLISRALHVSPADLLNPQSPEAIEQATENAAEILASLSPEKRRQWLEIGQALALQQKAS